MTLDWQPLKEWFKARARDLPWRQERTPYRVWVSEVMLQQTQVSVVIPYFEEWMRRFPTIENLANATREEVIKAWEGLGYYSRARHLHEGAKQVVERYQGILPSDATQLLSIKGLGAYTVGAICSFAFKQKMAAVDGNVLRVMSRLFASRADIGHSKTALSLRQQLQSTLPNEESWIVNEALIELGAMICRKSKPDCLQCPLKSQCLAYDQGLTQQLPIKQVKTKTERLYRIVFCLLSEENRLLLRRGEPGKLMADLYEFPFFESSDRAPTQTELHALIQQQWHMMPDSLEALATIEQSFTRYRAKLWPYLLLTKEFQAPSGFQWVDLSKLAHLPLSSGHRKIAKQITSSLLN